MNWLHNELWKGGQFQWWVLIGGVGAGIFFSRFFLQWYVTEKKKRVVVPVAFWWLSIVGSLIVLAYAIYRHDPVFIISYAFACIPYVRNLIIHHRHEDAQLSCAACGTVCAPNSSFCFACGARLTTNAAGAPEQAKS